MNRAERRRLKIQKTNDGYVRFFNSRKARLISEESSTDACPDCVADVQMWQEDGGVMHMVIQHDDTCPRLLGHLGE